MINEVYYNPDTEHGGANAEWIEIFNAGGSAINIQDWYFKNSSSGTETINQAYSLDPGQLAVVAANASMITEWGIIPSNAHKIALGGSELFNGLVNDGDFLQLFDSSNNLIDQMSYSSGTEGHSWERSPKGTGAFIDNAIPTPGS